MVAVIMLSLATICWGDSLTAGAGGTPYPTQLFGLTRCTVFKFGVGGETSTQIAIRQGGVGTTVRITGGSIPTSGGVTLTFPVGAEPVTAQGPSGFGSISGIEGTVSLSAGVYTFTRKATGSVTVIADDTPYVVIDAVNQAESRAAIWSGRNDYTSPATVKANIAAMVAHLGHLQYVVLSILNGDYAAEYVDGGWNYPTLIQLNADLAATYGSRYLDVRTPLVNSYDPTQAQDVIDHGHDIPPSSLRSDTIHLNTAGYTIVANLVWPQMGGAI